MNTLHVFAVGKMSYAHNSLRVAPHNEETFDELRAYLDSEVEAEIAANQLAAWHEERVNEELDALLEEMSWSG